MSATRDRSSPMPSRRDVREFDVDLVSNRERERRYELEVLGASSFYLLRYKYTPICVDRPPKNVS